MLVLIKSQNQEAQICKETLNKVHASSSGFVHKCFAHASWLKHAKPVLPLNTQTLCRTDQTVPTEKLSPHFHSPTGNMTRSTRSHPGDPVLPSCSSKGRWRTRKLLWDHLAGQVRQSAEQYHVNVSIMIQQAEMCREG